ncbi:MAG: hypothetical protein CV088_20365 [Nitrospira sp. LK70]|nr:hypothetical protein [Nitrospira sp. LK70]
MPEHCRDAHAVAETRSGNDIYDTVVLVIYTIKRRDHEKEIIRLISARQASRKERQAYARFTD